MIEIGSVQKVRKRSETGGETGGIPFGETGGMRFGGTRYRGGTTIERVTHELPGVLLRSFALLIVINICLKCIPRAQMV